MSVTTWNCLLGKMNVCVQEIRGVMTECERSILTQQLYKHGCNNKQLTLCCSSSFSSDLVSCNILCISDGFRSESGNPGFLWTRETITKRF